MISYLLLVSGNRTKIIRVWLVVPKPGKGAERPLHKDWYKVMKRITKATEFMDHSEKDLKGHESVKLF